MEIYTKHKAAKPYAPFLWVKIHYLKAAELFGEDASLSITYFTHPYTWMHTYTSRNKQTHLFPKDPLVKKKQPEEIQIIKL